MGVEERGTRCLKHLSTNLKTFYVLSHPIPLNYNYVNYRLSNWVYHQIRATIDKFADTEAGKKRETT